MSGEANLAFMHSSGWWLSRTIFGKSNADDETRIHKVQMYKVNQIVNLLIFAIEAKVKGIDDLAERRRADARRK